MIQVLSLLLVLSLTSAFAFPDAREEFTEVKERVKKLKSALVQEKNPIVLKSHKMTAFNRAFSSTEKLPHMDKEELEKIEFTLKQFDDAQTKSDAFLKRSREK